MIGALVLKPYPQLSATRLFHEHSIYIEGTNNQVTIDRTMDRLLKDAFERQNCFKDWAGGALLYGVCIQNLRNPFCEPALFVNVEPLRILGILVANRLIYRTFITKKISQMFYLPVQYLCV